MSSADEKKAPVAQESIEEALKSLNEFCHWTKQIVENYDKKSFSTNQDDSVDENGKKSLADVDFPDIDEFRKNILKDLANSIESQAAALDIALEGIRESMTCFVKLCPELREYIDRISDRIGNFQDYVLYPDHDDLEYIRDKLWEDEY